MHAIQRRGLLTPWVLVCLLGCEPAELAYDILLGDGGTALLYLPLLNYRHGSLDAVRPALQASTLMIIGAQTIFSSFFLDMLVPPRREAADPNGEA